MTTPLRLGIVGADASGQGWAPLAHFPALRALPQFEVVALCTSRAATAAAAAARYGVARAFHDPRELAAQEDLDLVSVVVRAPAHHDVVVAALEAGRNVYCEWPLGASTAQAERMAALADARGVRAMIGLQARADPVIRHARGLVADGYVGDVQSVAMVMTTAAAPERPASRAWERSAANGVSALTIRGIHALDALCFCVGELAEVSARVATLNRRWTIADSGASVDVDAPDCVVLAGTLVGGALVSAQIATVPCAAAGWRMEISGSRGALRIASSGAPQRDAKTLAGARGRAPLAALDGVPTDDEGLPAGVPPGAPRNVARMYLRLAQSLRAGTPVEPDFALALRRHRLIDAIQRASDERRAVAIPL